MKINKLTLNERKNDILSYFGEINAPCRTSEVAEHLGVSAYQARHYLQCLE
ncbi:F1845 fimbrial adhesin operon transcriptional regulator DaaF, partial [Escherichia coli]